MRRCRIIIFLLLSALSAQLLWAQVPEDSEEFRGKLSEMYARINKSVELLREQITENQAAPFLPNLYMQLGDLLTQKANVLYYIKMENMSEEGEAAEDEDDEKKFDDVVAATKEALVIFEKVLNEFPKFTGRTRALYAVALGYKSIDEKVPFLKAVQVLEKEFPTSQENTKAQILLGQHLFDMGMLAEAKQKYSAVARTDFNFEKNTAKYKLGLIAIADGQPKQALKYFEEVIVDDDLEEKSEELEVELSSGSVKSNLKREALIDSVRAYTEVYPKGASHDAVKFYSSIAPSEGLFREVMEKLSYRYINLKRYDEAIKLLRTLGERTASPLEVLNIYREVLLMIPLRDRVELPVEEMRYVYEKYLQWRLFYQRPKEVAQSADPFFEKQLRDLGTRSHEEGKKRGNPRKDFHLSQAVTYYEMYLATFPKSPYVSRMAMNMGDAYFRQEDYLKCADFYLRVFKGEFGKTEHQNLVLKNAVYCAEKEKEYSFYELRRVKGLLIESLTLLKKTDKSKEKDPKTNFALAKAIYDQGFYTKALQDLLDFMKAYPRTRYAVDSADLILDYFNLKSDFDNLVIWSDRILKLNLPNKPLNVKVAKIKEQAKVKKLQSQVEASAGFDSFAQGKSYLENAASIQNVELRNLALQKALEASKREKDIMTFLSSANLIASKEQDPAKRYEIEASLASEHVKMGNYQQAFETYRKIVNTGGYTDEQKQSSFNEMIALLIATRDWENLASSARSPLFAKIPAETRSQLEEQVTNLLESPIEVPASLDQLLSSMKPSPTLALGLFKGRYKLSSTSQGSAVSAVKQVCSSSDAEAVCRWAKVEGVDRQAGPVKNILRSQGSLERLEQVATRFAGVTDLYMALEGVDGQLDMLVSLRLAELYKLFANHLQGIAKANPSLQQVLVPKSRESFQTAQSYQKRCQQVIETARIVSPTNQYCRTGQNPSVAQALRWPKLYPAFGMRRPGVEAYLDVKKEVFAAFKSETILKLSKTFYQNKDYHYAMASAIYGLSLGGGQGELNTVLGCSVLSLGYFNEAQFYLLKGESVDGLKPRCLKMLKGLVP